MISVIMPTMFMIDGTVERIKEVCAHPLVGEVIVIDNTLEGGNIQEEISKLIYIEEKQNTFVNPAWNKGTAISKYDKLMFLNDDVITDFSLIDKVYDHITEDKGMIGLGEGCWENTGEVFEIKLTYEQRLAYACLFFMHKKSYINIPEDLKVWYGDNWLFEKTGKQPYKIVNWKVGGYISATIFNVPKIFSVAKEDEAVWIKKYMM